MLFGKKNVLDRKKSHDLLEKLGQPRLKPANFNHVYRDYSPEQMEELIHALEDTIRFLTYQRNLSSAYHQERFEEVKRLLKEPLSSNLAYLRKDKAWLLKVLIGSLEG